MYNPFDDLGYAPGDSPGSFTGSFPSDDFGPGDNPGPFTGTFMPPAQQPPFGPGTAGFGTDSAPASFLPNLGGILSPGEAASSTDWRQILNQILGLGSTGGTSALTLPLLASALQQWQQGDKYLDYGREAADMASPISNEERLRSLGTYRQWEEDPNKFLESNPVYQGALRQGLNAAERSNAAKGLLGSGEMLIDLQRVGQDTAGKFIQDELRRLREDAGFQFNPAHAADLFMRGAEGRLNSQSNALAALGMAAQNMAQGGQPITINNNPNGAGSQGRPVGGGGGSPSGSGGSAGGFNINPTQIAQLATQFGLSPQQLFSLFGQTSSFGIDPNTSLSLINSGLPTIFNDPLNPGAPLAGSSPLEGLIDPGFLTGGGGGSFGPIDPFGPGGYINPDDSFSFGDDITSYWDYFFGSGV